MIIKTYAELKSYFDMFRKQDIDLLIVLSRGGLGKTSTLKSMMKDDEYVYINTHSTPLRTYQMLYEKQDGCVVFDDIDSILKNSIFVSMLKALADTSEVKELHYNTTSKLLGEVPETFRTTSNVCILINEFSAKNPVLAPLLDRGMFVEFAPSKDEVMTRIKEVAKSQSIAQAEKCVYSFINENKDKINNLSIRTYIKALQLFRYEPAKWKERFMQMIGFSEKAIKYLKLRDMFKTDKERIEHFGWSRATYFRVKEEVEDEVRE